VLGLQDYTTMPSSFQPLDETNIHGVAMVT
jgi:hypothetical protein